MESVKGFEAVVGRRGFLKMAAGVGALAIAGATSLPKVAGAQSALPESGWYQTTSRLNLRATPSTSAKILKVLEKGWIVESLGERKNGFVKVMHNGTWGWAHGDYLMVSNGGSSDPPKWIGKSITNDSVNFRTGPSTGHAVIQYLPKGTVVSKSDLVRYGFRYVKLNGQVGWVYDDYLSNYSGGGGGNGGGGSEIPDDGSTAFRTTSSVNLRSKPSTSSKVLKVVAEGEIVLDYDLVMSNGFRGVDYKGTVGWIYDDYLKKIS